MSRICDIFIAASLIVSALTFAFTNATPFTRSEVIELELLLAGWLLIRGMVDLAAGALFTNR